MLDFRAIIIDRFEASGVVAILRIKAPGRIPMLVEALLEGGISVIEIPMNTPQAEEMLAFISRTYGETVCLGAGTVLDREAARRAVSSGATYLVSPVLKQEIIQFAHDHGVAAIPGCLTPSEVLQAHEAGADLVKLFPADVLGPGFIRSLLGPMPFLRLMPTGGIRPDEVGAWIRAGALCVGMGGALTNLEDTPDDRSRLVEKARKIRGEIEKARSLR